MEAIRLSKVFILLLGGLLLWGNGCSAQNSDFQLEIEIDPVWSQKVIAHRGYWQVAGAVQNSLSSLREAMSLDIYGAEFDIRQTADGTIILCHDSEYEGMDIATSSYDQLYEIKLKNGEKIPTLSDLLEESKSIPEFKIILDIKDVDISELVRLIGEHDALYRVEFFSFSLDHCVELLSLNKNFKVFYLQGDLHPVELAPLGIYGIAYPEQILLNTKLIKRAAAEGMASYVWVVNTKRRMNFFLNNGVDYIITDYPNIYGMPN